MDKEKIYLNISKDYLAQEKVTYTHGSIANVYVVYSMKNVTHFLTDTDDDIMGNCMCGATSIINKEHSGYGIDFSLRRYLHKNSGENAKKLIIFEK